MLGRSEHAFRAYRKLTVSMFGLSEHALGVAPKACSMSARAGHVSARGWVAPLSKHAVGATRKRMFERCEHAYGRLGTHVRTFLHASSVQTHVRTVRTCVRGENACSRYANLLAYVTNALRTHVGCAGHACVFFERMFRRVEHAFDKKNACSRGVNMRSGLWKGGEACSVVVNMRSAFYIGPFPNSEYHLSTNA